MLNVILPFDCKIEANWISSVFLGEFLGLPFKVLMTGDSDFIIRYSDRMLTISDVFFSISENKWLKPSTLPDLPLVKWNLSNLDLDVNLVNNTIPVLFGQPRFYLDESGNGHLNLDVFGSAFFMLSRYEEAVLIERDSHDRFPATASIAYRAGFLGRPIVDEYVEILWAAMKRVWPNLERKKRKGQILVSCDVDVPYSSYVKRTILTMKKMTGDIVKRRSIRMSVKSGINAIATRLGRFNFEPNNTFEWIMDVNEIAGNKVMFNFIAGHTVPDLDGFYSLDEHRIRKLMRRIYERGHEIGLHGSYDTYKSVEQQILEANRLRRVMDEEHIFQDQIGNRQHYLRWSTPETARNLEKAGINYDTTLGYAEHPGFRCGTCFEYPMYDLIDRAPLQLRQRPLIVMEDSVIKYDYLGMGHTNDSLYLMLKLKKRALQYGGNFTLLWHNSNVITAQERELYEALI